MRKLKRSTSILIAPFLMLVIAATQAAVAEELSAVQLGALESADIPLYPGSTYTTGDDEIATIMWFKSKDSPDEIMDWYKDNLSGWSELDVNDSRIIYKGSEGIETKDLSTKVYIWARTTDESGVSTDSEITIHIPE